MRALSSPDPATGEPAPSPASEAALAALYDAHVDDVYRFCLARSGDPDVAADATAEVFLAAAKVFATGHRHQVTRAWLFTVAKNRLVDHWRRASRRERRIERLASVGGAQSQARDLGDGMPMIAAADVVDALGSLPDRQRAALTLRYLEELSVAEIADQLELSYRAAESLLARARRSFERAWASRSEHERGGER